MPRLTRAQRAAALVAFAVLGAASCSSEPDDGTIGSSTSLTEPGADLEVGDTATVTRGGQGEVLEVAITDITAGSATDLAGPDRGLDEAAFYVDYVLTHVSGPSPYLPVNNFLTGWSGETQLTMLAPTDSAPPCETKTFAQDAPIGSTVEGCAIFIAEGGAPLDRLQFSYGDDYDSFDGNEVSWKPSP